MDGMPERTVTVSLSVEEAILLSFISHRWEVRHRFELTNVSEYFAIRALGGRLFETEAVVSRVWKDLALTEEGWDEAAREAAESIANGLREYNWPPEWFEKYPPSAARLTMGTDEFTIQVLRSAGAEDIGKSIGDVLTTIAEQRCKATGEPIELVLREILDGIQTALADAPG
jgi:hypothetical protein